MRVAGEHLSEIRTRGYTLGPRFLADDELGAAQACLWDEFPRPADYFADPSAHHCDFGNHSLVVPRTDGIGAQLTSFILLSDVTPLDGPTAIVLITHSEHISKMPDDTEPGLAVPGPARRLRRRRDPGHRACRSLFGFPSPGDPYWNDQTASLVQQRYPNIDMTPYEVVN